MSIGGFVNIGLVFNEKKNYIQVLKSTLEFFIQNGSELLDVKYSIDKDGESWIEKKIKGEELDELVTSGYYLTYGISGESLGVNSNKVDLTIIKEADYFGFLLNIKWDDLFPDNTEKVGEITEQLVSTLITYYKSVDFSYSFIGHEIEIEMPPVEFEHVILENDCYPVAFIGRKNKRLEVHYGSLCIDGITSQVQKQEVILM